MNKIKWKTLVVSCIACLVPILYGIIYYEQLPEQMASHFNVHGIADSYMDKNVILFGLPILICLLQCFLCYKSDVINGSVKTPRVEYIFKFVLPFTSFLVYFLTIRYSLGAEIDIRRVILLFLGVMFILIGNYMPKVSGNYKTQVSLSLLWLKKYHEMDPNLRKRFYRDYGYIMFVIGIIYLGSVFLNDIAAVFVMLSTIVIMILYAIYFIIKVYCN